MPVKDPRLVGRGKRLWRYYLWDGGALEAVDVTHTFTAADSPSTVPVSDSGHTATVVTGTWGISSNQLYTSAALAESRITWDAEFAPARVTITASVFSGQMGPVLAYQDANNWIRFVKSGASGFLQVREGGVTTTLQTAAVAVSNGNTMGIGRSGTTITAYVNDVAVLSGTSSALSAVTVAGVEVGDTTARVDNLSITRA